MSLKILECQKVEYLVTMYYLKLSLSFVIPCNKRMIKILKKCFGLRYMHTTRKKHRRQGSSKNM